MVNQDKRVSRLEIMLSCKIPDIESLNKLKCQEDKFYNIKLFKLLPKDELMLLITERHKMNWDRFNYLLDRLTEKYDSHINQVSLSNEEIEKTKLRRKRIETLTEVQKSLLSSKRRDCPEVKPLYDFLLSGKPLPINFY